MMRKAKIQKLTAPELRKQWCIKFKQQNGEEYFPFMAPIREIKLLKDAVDEYGKYIVAMSMDDALEDGISSSIPSFIEALKWFSPTIKYPKIYYYVEKYGGEEERDLLFQLDLLQGNQFQTADSMEIEKNTVNDLYRWIEELRNE